MCRIKQELSQEINQDILKRRHTGVLAVLNNEGYPYTIPLNYIYSNGHIYFHCATSGHKIDAIKQHQKVSFCVIDLDELKPEKFNTYFRSVIVFGKAKIINEETEKKHIIESFTSELSPLESKEKINKEIEKNWNRLGIIDLTIENITGKESLDLVN